MLITSQWLCTQFAKLQEWGFTEFSLWTFFYLHRLFFNNLVLSILFSFLLKRGFIYLVLFCLCTRQCIFFVQIVVRSVTTARSGNIVCVQWDIYHAVWINTVMVELQRYWDAAQRHKSGGCGWQGMGHSPGTGGHTAINNSTRNTNLDLDKGKL